MKRKDDRPSSMLTATNLSFRYGRSSDWITRDLSMTLTVRPTVLIGPNGAGKSTLLRLLAGLFKPTSGIVTRVGSIGFAPQFTPAIPGFSVVDQVQYASWLAGVGRADSVELAARAIGLTGLDDLRSRRATELSGGELARLGIASAIAANPDHLLLDEPTASLDPISRRAVVRVLGELVASGVGLTVTSHTASDIGPPFERLIVLDHGAVAFDDTLEVFFTRQHRTPIVNELSEAIRGH